MKESISVWMIQLNASASAHAGPLIYSRGAPTSLSSSLE